MADIYCRSTDGADADDGSTWALADATLAAALTAAGVGGVVYVSDNHAEATGASVTLACPGTAASPNIIMSVNDAGDPEPPTALLAGGSVSTGVGAFALTITGFGVFKGLTFIRPGTNSAALNIGTAATPFFLKFEDSTFTLSTTNVSGEIVIGGNSTTLDDSRCEWENCNVTFGNVGHAILVRAPFFWTGGSAAATGSVPTSLFEPAGGVAGNAVIRGVDLSAFTAGKSLVNVAALTFADYKFINCKLGASVTATTGTHPGQGGITVELINCDVDGASPINIRNEWWGYQGNIVTWTTNTRTGGANDGTNAISLRMTSSANTKFYSPLVFNSAFIRNENTGSSVTATVHILTDNVTLTDKEIWLEVDFLGTSGSVLQSVSHDHASDDNMFLGTGANQATSVEAWTTTGLTTPVYQKLEVTFTPQIKGPIRFRVMLAKPSTVVYVCPEVVMSDQSSAAQYQLSEGVYLLAPAAGGGGSALHLGALGQTGIGSF